MFNKTMLALTAAALIGSASAAFSYEDPESRIGDKYPWLDQTSRTFTARNIGGPYVPVRQVARLDQPYPEDVEARTGDKYPSLEQTAPPTSAARVLNARVSMRQAQRVQYYEDAESRTTQFDSVSPQSRNVEYVSRRVRPRG